MFKYIINTPAMSDPHHDSESFYSVYSHHSIFNEGQQSPPKKNSINQHIKLPVMSKIAQSNFHFDQFQLNGSQGTIKKHKVSTLVRNNDYQEMREMDNHKENKCSGQKDIQKQAQNEYMGEVHNISEIQQRAQVLQQSMCLLKEIDCLSVEQVSPEELKQIKSKIDHLKKEQFNLQSSLLMASELLRNAKSRNTILQQELVYYRMKEEAKTHDKQMNGKYPPIQETLSPGIGKEHRYFQQQAGQSTNSALNKLKALYKQCSTSQSYCVYQNDGYKIQITYFRKKSTNQKCVQVVEVKLTPHHHIVSRKQFKFGLEAGNTDKNKQSWRMEDMSYDGALVTQQYASWLNQSFHFSLLIHQLDEVNHYHHSHTILVPLPITHFFEPRLTTLSQPLTSVLKRNLSRYSLGLSGSISTDSLEKLKETWWISRFISCLGEDQIVYVEVKPQNSVQKTVAIDIYGKMNGRVVKGVIEFLSFYLVT